MRGDRYDEGTEIRDSRSLAMMKSTESLRSIKTLLDAGLAAGYVWQ